MWRIMDKTRKYVKRTEDQKREGLFIKVLIKVSIIV